MDEIRVAAVGRGTKAGCEPPGGLPSTSSPVVSRSGPPDGTSDCAALPRCSRQRTFTAAAPVQPPLPSCPVLAEPVDRPSGSSPSALRAGSSSPSASVAPVMKATHRTPHPILVARDPERLFVTRPGGSCRASRPRSPLHSTVAIVKPSAHTLPGLVGEMIKPDGGDQHRVVGRTLASDADCHRIGEVMVDPDVGWRCRIMTEPASQPRAEEVVGVV